MLPLPNDVLNHIYSYDATYYEMYRKPLHELVINHKLKELFERDCIVLIHQPRRLAKYSKEDFECFARQLGILSSRRNSRKRLIAKLCCYYLQKGKLWFLPIGSKGMWIFS